ncbi:MAG: acyl-CoA/acyl-ACP dehydrogenase [Halioglobus sp.]|nr:acyl-CoA/acyl-ACP dehydrogenase [Halioglobus sp.]
MSVIGETTLHFSEEQAMLLDVAREFCRNRAPVDAARQQLESEAGYDTALWDDMVELGWAGISLPESVGGSALGVAALVPVLESMGRSLVAAPLLSSALAGQLLLRAGGESQCGDWLAEIAGGAVATVAWLESGDWGDVSLATELDAQYVMQGAKRFVPDALAARYLLVPVMHRGEVALAVVESAQLSAQALAPNTLVDLTKRAANVDFTGLQIEEQSVIIGPQVAVALADVRLLGALLVAAEATGSAAACLDTVVGYLNTRKQFGKLIGSYQALKHPCVDILLGVDAARSFIYHAGSVVGDGRLDRDAEIACRMAKAQACETLAYAGDRAVQFHGGMGFTWECDAQLYLRRAQWSQQQFGDPQHHCRRLAALLLDD